MECWKSGNRKRVGVFDAQTPFMGFRRSLVRIQSPRHDGGAEATRSCGGPSPLFLTRFFVELQQKLQQAPRVAAREACEAANLTVHHLGAELEGLP